MLIAWTSIFICLFLNFLILNIWFVYKLLFFSVNKQINDKERIAAAMENPNLRELVENCIKEED